jgi:hypothetical protein
MTWSILLAFLIVLAIMSVTGRQQVAWSAKMQRVNAGSARRAEWMAPEVIVKQVEKDYVTAMRWLPESMTQSWSTQWTGAPYYFSGLYLKRHQEILKHYRVGRTMRYVGIMRCVHDVTVRHFSDDGERCLVIDHQTDRRMATYSLETGERLNTQDLGAGSFVYEMAYDKHAKRWKVDRYIQQLPLGWNNRKKSTRMRVLPALPPTIGRDN